MKRARSDDSPQLLHGDWPWATVHSVAELRACRDARYIVYDSAEPLPSDGAFGDIGQELSRCVPLVTAAKY